MAAWAHHNNPHLQAARQFHALAAYDMRDVFIRAARNDGVPVQEIAGRLRLGRSQVDLVLRGRRH